MFIIQEQSIFYSIKFRTLTDFFEEIFNVCVGKVDLATEMFVCKEGAT